MLDSDSRLKLRCDLIETRRHNVGWKNDDEDAGSFIVVVPEGAVLRDKPIHVARSISKSVIKRRIRRLNCFNGRLLLTACD